MTELLGRISEVTWRDTLQEGASRSAQEESVSGGAPHLLPSASSDETSAGALQDDGTDTPKMPPPTRSSPLQQHGHVHREVTPSVTCLGAAARAVARRNASHSSRSGHLATIATGHTLSELRRLDLYIKRFLPDIAHQTCEQESAGKYAYAATDISKRSAGEKVVVIPNTFNEAMSLPARVDVLERGLGRTRRHFVVLGTTCVFVEGELSACCVG